MEKHTEGSERVCLANAVRTQELVFGLAVGEVIMFIIPFSFLNGAGDSPDAQPSHRTAATNIPALTKQVSSFNTWRTPVPFGYAVSHQETKGPITAKNKAETAWCKEISLGTTAIPITSLGQILQPKIASFLCLVQINTSNSIQPPHFKYSLPGRQEGTTCLHHRTEPGSVSRATRAFSPPTQETLAELFCFIFTEEDEPYFVFFTWGNQKITVKFKVLWRAETFKSIRQPKTSL